MSNSTPARRVYDFDDLKEPGQFMFTGRKGIEGHAGLLFVCPCGCGDMAGIQFKKLAEDHGPCWQWDGNEDRPTVTPSIRRLNGCQWHGFLTNGAFVQC